MMIQLLREMQGYVKFKAKGSFTEKFLNLAVLSEVPVWGVVGKNGTVYAYTYARSYKKLYPMAKKSSTRLHVEEKHGFPFLLFRTRRRPGVFVGMAAFFALVHFLSLFVWNIQVQGNIQLPEEQIKQVVEELGLGVGSYRNNLNLSLLQGETMLKLPEVSWLTMYTKGSTVVIDLREGQKVPDIVPDDRPCNIKAAVGGQIIKIEAKVGQGAVEHGDVVAPGDLLISGITEGINGETFLHHASGKVIAATSRTIKETVALEQRILVPTGNVLTRRRLQIFGMEIPLSFSSAPQEDTYTREVKKQPLSVFGVQLPAEFSREIWTENEWKQVKYTAQEAEKIAEAAVNQRMEEEFENITVISSEKRLSVEENQLVYELVLQCEENIGYEDEILIN